MQELSSILCNKNHLFSDEDIASTLDMVDEASSLEGIFNLRNDRICIQNDLVIAER